MRRIHFLTIALLTFVSGTALTNVYRWMLNKLDHPPAVEVSIPPADIRESLTPLRMGIFIGVDGATLSADGKKFEFFDDYKQRETLLPISPAELSDLVAQLRVAGLFEEAELNSPFFISLPQTFTIVIAWPDEQRSFTWIPGDKCRVPDKYLQIFERLNRNLQVTLIQDFIAHNQRVAAPA